ncbi:MAG: hypothetical protein ACRCU6_08415 [Fusobacteriaceae bacterium]
MINKYGIEVLDQSIYSEMFGPISSSPKGEEEGFPKIQLPKGLARMEEYFEVMAKDLISPALEIISKMRREARNFELPEINYNLVNKEGWHGFTNSGEYFKVEDVPKSEWLVFDTETFVKGSEDNMPIIGTAIGSEGGECCVYIWVHKSLINPEVEYKPQCVPVGSGKVLVMHNSSFDAAKIQERFTLNTLENYIICTQSLNNICNSLDSSQRWAKHYTHQLVREGYNKDMPSFIKVGCGESLVDCYEFHTGNLLDKDAKDPRKLFVESDHLSQIKDKFEICLEYAVKDVVYTLELFLCLWPKYRRQAPSLCVLAGQMVLNNCVLPVRPNWEKWISECEYQWTKYNKEMETLLNDLADIYYNKWLEDKNIENDFWLCNLDWSDSFGFPKWYSKKAIFNEPLSLTGKSRDAHYLLKLCWNGYPLEYLKGQGWKYKIGEENYGNIPHSSGKEENVASVLTSFYSDFVDKGILSPDSDAPNSALRICKRICELITLTSYWTGNRQRIKSLRFEHIENPEDGTKMTLVAPHVKAHGTSSSRAIENVFLVAASHATGKIGSEIAQMAYSYPNSYKFVGHDVDSEELQIARIYGDSYAGISGSNQFSQAILLGKKEDGTEFHSITGKEAEVSRDCSKQINYGVFYGAGIKACSASIIYWHPEYPPEIAVQKARKAIEKIRGTQDRTTKKYSGGIASLSFNKMVDIVTAPEPFTPIFKTKAPLPIWPIHSQRGITPSLTNWSIQSSAATGGMLSALLVANTYNLKKYGIKNRFCISKHDIL